jgi:transcriptional regulator with XRE-family HTH domain
MTAVPADTPRSGSVPGPIKPLRAIAAVLKQLRKDSGESLKEVAEALLISRSKLSRLETAQGKPMLRDIRDLIRHYGIEGTPQARRLERWVKAAQEPAWWTEFDDELLEPDGLTAYIAFEADAVVERAYTLPFVPALLQTREYAAAYFRALGRRSDSEIEQLVTVRERRKQELFARDGQPPLRLVAVMYESALRQVVGSVQIMRDQLGVLAEKPSAPHVHLHVLPFTAAPLFSMTCMYAHFEYDAEGLDQDAVKVESHAGFVTIEDPVRVASYRAAHDALVAAALTEEDSRAFIRSVREELYGA